MCVWVKRSRSWNWIRNSAHMRASARACIVTGCFFLSGFLQAHPLVITPDTEELDLARNLELVITTKLPTPEEAASPDFGPFRPHTGSGAPSLGYTKETAVLRISFDNQSNRRSFILQLGQPMTGYFELVMRGSDGKLNSRISGFRIPFSKRPMHAQLTAFPIDLPPGMTTIYVIAQSDETLLLPAVLRTPESFADAETLSHLFFATLIGAILLIGSYNLFIYFATLDRSYLFYSLYAVSNAFYFAVQQGYVYRYILPDFPKAALWCMPYAITLLGTSCVLFLRAFLRPARTSVLLDRIGIGLIAATVAAALVVGFLPYGTAMKLAVPVIGGDVLYMGIAAGILAFRGQRGAVFYLIAFSLLILGALLIILRVLGFLPANTLTIRAVHIGAMAELLLLSFALGDRIRFLQANLTERLRDLAGAKRELEVSEEKYRRLVEDTSDLIFSLDAELRILTINHAIIALLGFRPENWIGRDFRDLLQSHETSGSVETLLMEEKLSEARRTTVNFKTPLLTRRGEAREMMIKLEPVENGKRLFGRASAVIDDSLLRFFVTEKQTFVIDNYFILGELLGERLTRNLTRYISADDAVHVRLGLLEIVINAIEHGNLDISYAEKTHVMENGNYLHYLADRQLDPRFRNRKVTVEYAVDPEGVSYRVTDEGKGFDSSRMLERASNPDNMAGELHGRGIMMAVDAFNKIEYNEKGNSVLLHRSFVARKPPNDDGSK